MKKKHLICIVIFFYSFITLTMEKEQKPTKPISIKSMKQEQVANESYYNKLLAMLSGQSWDSDLNYSTPEDTLGDVSVFSESDADMNGSISFESKNPTPLSSPRKHTEQSRENHELCQKKNLFYWFCCPYRKQAICYEEIK